MSKPKAPPAAPKADFFFRASNWISQVTFGAGGSAAAAIAIAPTRPVTALMIGVGGAGLSIFGGLIAASAPRFGRRSVPAAQAAVLAAVAGLGAFFYANNDFAAADRDRLYTTQFTNECAEDGGRMGHIEESGVGCFRPAQGSNTFEFEAMYPPR
jgi:hypothetical protein